MKLLQLTTKAGRLARRALLAGGSALAACGGGDPVGGAPLPVYRIELPALRSAAGAVDSSVAFSVGGRGDVVGTFTAGASRHAYRWAEGRMTLLAAPAGGDAIAYDVASDGRVVGSSAAADGWRAVVWGADGAASWLPASDGLPPRDAAHGINDRGDVVGVGGPADAPVPMHWRDGSARRLASLDPLHPLGEAFGIDADGRVVGASATAGGLAPVLWHPDGRVQDLGRLPGAGEEFGIALAIGSGGRVVGVAAAAAGRRAFVWHAGRIADLGDLPGGADLSIAYSVNRHGHVVGSSQVLNGSGDSRSATEPALLHHAFYWSAATGMVDLNDLVAADDPLRGRVTLLESAVIRDDGTVSGRALAEGRVVAYVLRPQPRR